MQLQIRTDRENIVCKAFNEDGLRFTKNVSYEPDGGLVIKSHRNIEDRQITDRILLMQASTPGKLKWTDRVMQSGKNVETTLVTEILTKAVFSVEQAKMNQQEVLNLLKKKQWTMIRTQNANQLTEKAHL